VQAYFRRDRTATKNNTMLAENMQRKYREINPSEANFPRTKAYFDKKDTDFDKASAVPHHFILCSFDQGLGRGFDAMSDTKLNENKSAPLS